MHAEDESGLNEPLKVSDKDSSNAVKDEVVENLEGGHNAKRS
jgi:hypothetical protein